MTPAPQPLAKLLAMMEAAKLPWRLETEKRPGYDEWTFSVYGSDDAEVLSDGHYDYEGYGCAPSKAEAEFATAAVNALPALLAELAELRAGRDAVIEECAKVLEVRAAEYSAIFKDSHKTIHDTIYETLARECTECVERIRALSPPRQSAETRSDGTERG